MSGNSPTLSRTASPSLDDGVLPSQIRLSGFLWGLSPAPFLVPFIEPGGAFQQILVIGAVFGLAFAGTLSPRSPNLARRVLFVTLLDLLVLLSRPLLTSPALFLIALLVLTAPAWWFWERSRTLGSALDPGHRETVRASGAAQAGLIVWGLVGMHLGTQVQYDQLWPLGLSLAVGMITSAAWLVFEAPRHAARGVLLTLVLGFDVLVGKSVAGDPANWLVFAAIVPLASLLILPPGKLRGRDRVNWLEPVLGHPSRLLVVTFAGFSLLGSILLASPFATVQGRATGLLDAFFTSVSAVCVTGLIVKDTATHFTFGGQLILLGLIQIGGLGIMTFSTAALRLLGRRMSLKTEGAVAGLISAEDRGQLYAATGRLLAFTLA